MFHPILARELENLRLSAGQAPDPRAWNQLLDAVNRSLAAADVDRRRLHEQLAEQRDKLQAIIAAIPDGLCVIDRHRRIDFINPAGARMLGCTEEQLRGAQVSRIDVVGKSSEVSVSGAVDRALLLGEGTRCDEASLRKIDGTPICVAFGVTAVEGGHAQAAVLLFRDTSERRQLEISLRHAQKLESIGRLAAGVAHEINTPIQFIGDNVKFLGDTFKDLGRMIDEMRDLIEAHTAEDVRGLAAEAYEAADADYVMAQAPKAIANSVEGVQRVANIVRAMKSLAHQDRGEQALADLNAAINNTLIVARNEYKYVADVVTDLKEIPPVRCYLNDINQVILNLLVNAAHAVGDRVKGTEERGLIKVATRWDGETVLISLSDNGTGIPEHIRSRIFEPFFTTKEVGRGTGQGLALARAIITDKHQGELWFETEVGKGTTFFIRLPVAEIGNTIDLVQT